MLSDSCPIGTAVKGHQQRYQNPTKKGGWNLPSGPQSAELQVAACNLQPDPAAPPILPRCFPRGWR
jgi:hypothetical protein